MNGYSYLTEDAQQQLAGSLGQQMSCLQPQIVYQCPRSDLGELEFRIWPYGKEVWMDYGSRLKILMADPIRGIDLREAVQKLKEALQKMEE